LPAPAWVLSALSVLSAVGALVSLVSAIPVALDADDAIVFHAWHDVLGFPPSTPGCSPCWHGEHEATLDAWAMAIPIARLARGTADDDALSAWIDGALTLVLVAAFVLARGHMAWSRPIRLDRPDMETP